jgi:hypothetical protein
LWIERYRLFKKEDFEWKFDAVLTELVFTSTPTEEPGKWWHDLVVVGGIHNLMEPFHI